MSTDSIGVARRAVLTAMAELRALERNGDGQSEIEGLRFQRRLQRQSDHDSLALIAALDQDGEFTERGMYPAPAVADILRCDRRESRRLVKIAGSLFATTVVGVPVAPRLPATATALAGFEIDLAHAEVIDHALSTDAAGRIDPGRWADAESQLADWARVYTPDELRALAAALIEQLDADGTDPELDAQVNELHLTPSADKIGGRIKGRLDSVTFDALAQALHGLLAPEVDEGKSLGQRQADALGELCEHTLDEGCLPDRAGEKPHLTVTVRYSDLKRGLRGGSLNATGLRIGPKTIRRIACDSAVIAVLLSGRGEPLDVGREHRFATKYQRRALAARDGGCAHPGCGRPATWCIAHHILEWENGGPTSIDNMVLLCRTHHVMIHSSGWAVRIRDGLPEFIPPKWLDIDQKPRRKERSTQFPP